MSIPKIIHQIWIQGYDNIPKHLKEMHENCVKINDDFKFIVWDDDKIKKFLKDNFKPKYLEVYNMMTIPAQKADFARYAILYKYGGIYLDMDMVCRKNLNYFLKHKVFFTTKKDLAYHVYPRYLNGIIGAVPNHKLFKIIFKNIFEREKHYDNVTYSTGTRLLYDSVQNYREYMSKNNNKNKNKQNNDKNKENNYDIEIVDAKYLHPCTMYQDEKTCPYKCTDCYIAHTNNSSWSTGLKIFMFIKRNLLALFVILAFIIILIFHLIRT